MSDSSPLFVSALELVAHATEIFAQKNPKKYKFVILHLANAIELILKDYILDLGISIYKNPKETIGIQDCFHRIAEKDIKIPEKPILELLIDDRNTIQHRFGYPDEISVYYYLEKVIAFFKEFLNTYYGVNLEDALEPHLSSQHLELLGLVKSEYAYLEQLMKMSPEAATLHAYSIVEKELIKMVGELPFQPLQERNIIRRSVANQVLKVFLDELEQKKYVNPDIYERFKELRYARNIAAHDPVREGGRKIGWNKVFNTAIELIDGIEKAQKDNYIFVKNNNNSDEENSSS